MLFDDGSVKICKLENTAESGQMPKEKLLQVSEYLFGERTVGYGRQYAAKGVNQQVDMMIRIWQDRTIKIGMYAVIDEEQYRIDNVQHLYDDDGLRVTDLTLQQLEDLYDVSGED